MSLQTRLRVSSGTLSPGFQFAAELHRAAGSVSDLHREADGAGPPPALSGGDLPAGPHGAPAARHLPRHRLGLFQPCSGKGVDHT